MTTETEQHLRELLAKADSPENAADSSRFSWYSPEQRLREELRRAAPALLDELARLRAEKERLRGALQQIVDDTPANEPDKWHHHHHYLVLARAALGEKP